MRRVLPLTGLLLALATALAGCRGPEIRLLPAKPLPAVPPPSEPAVAAITAIEPDLKTLPRVEPGSDGGSVRPPGRGIAEAEVARVAAERALTANLLQTESSVPRAVLTDRHGVPLTKGDDDALIREVRALAATEARNRTASEALVAFFQLADAEGRGDVLRKSVILLDQLKAAVKDAKAKGAKVPVEPDELDRQRAGLLALLGQADLGAKLLDVDLKRRLGLPGTSADRLLPTGDFGLSAPTPDATEAVARALERRGDLQALRTAYLRLNTDTLSSVREYIRALPGVAGLVGGGPPQLPFVRRLSERRLAPSVAALDAVLVAEVEVRKRQLWAVIEEKERGTADEVRADVIAAVMQWHQARVRANAAMGLYAGDGR